MENKILYEEKECGLTMKQFLENIHKKYPDKKYTFAARLDPMACGIVPLVPKDEFKNFSNYLKSDKTYMVRVLVGIQTDSDDVLGLVENINPELFGRLSKEELKDIFKKTSKLDFEQKYHYFSSKRICKRNKGDTTEYTHNVSLYNLKIFATGKITIKNWLNEAITDIDKVDKECNFRQDEIISQWKQIKNEYGNNMINYIDLELNVSSGFFVRQFIRDTSDEVNFPMLAYYITRTKIN